MITTANIEQDRSWFHGIQNDLMEDVSKYMYAQIYAQTAPIVNVNVGGIHEEVYANRLSDADQNAIINRASGHAARSVANSLSEALRFNLR